MTYYNTNKLQGDDLLSARIRGGKQEEIVLELFIRLKRSLLTPPEVQEWALPEAPLTSVRRAMTDLTKEGYLIKTKVKKTGLYGQPNFCWRLNWEVYAKAEQMNLFD